ncbi:hypothetical protein [Niabella beijingensis]|nr:hypothetical protein [Niabella beijingensis]MBZ4191022.1 hypothetical protein [Niabella beijingensis]
MSEKNNIQETERAPLLGSWSRWYILVIAVLFILIACFYQITKTFS